MARRGKEQWIEIGLELLVEDGPNALTVDRLCAEVGKTKGSFYHHFDGVSGFRKNLLDYWEKTHTQDLIEQTLDDPLGGAKAHLRRLAGQLNFHQETAFRVWSRCDSEAAGVVARVDLSRVEHLRNLSQQEGRSTEEAESIAWLEYLFYLGLAQVADSISIDKRRDLRQQFARKVLGP